MAEAPRGRDVFVDGSHSPAQIAVLFGEAFGAPRSGIVAEDALPEQWAEAWGQKRRIEIYRLERDGDFAFKVLIDLEVPIDVNRFPALARQHWLTIAWAVDEASEHDSRYHVAFPDGSIGVHLLAFRETDESYACLLLAAG